MRVGCEGGMGCGDGIGALSKGNEGGGGGVPR